MKLATDVNSLNVCILPNLSESICISGKTYDSLLNSASEISSLRLLSLTFPE